jgi:hypothetical protein
VRDEDILLRDADVSRVLWAEFGRFLETETTELLCFVEIYSPTLVFQL